MYAGVRRFSFEPQPLDFVVVREGGAELPPHLTGRTLRYGIRFYQGGVRGYPHPANDYIHAAWVLGELHPCLMDAAVELGVLDAVDRERYSNRGPWLVEATSPHCTITHWCEFYRRNVAVTRLHVFDGKPPSYLQQRLAQRFAWAMYGTLYDYPQLIGIMVHGFLHATPHRYAGKIDLGKRHTVCSALCATGIEVVRRGTIDAGAPGWPRLFGGQAVEVLPPAGLHSPPRGRLGVLGLGRYQWPQELRLVWHSGAPEDHLPQCGELAWQS